MMQKDPSKRFSAEAYLEMAQGKAFPRYFYSFLFKYMQGFLMACFVSPQDKMNRLVKTFKSFSILKIYKFADHYFISCL